MGVVAISRSGDTARTLILAGLAIQVLQVLVFLGVGLWLLSLPFFGGVFGGIFLALAFLGVVWVILVYIYSYLPTAAGEYEAARTPTLVFAALSLLTVGLVSGILYIIAYSEMKDAEREGPEADWGAESLGPLPGPKYCSTCGRPVRAGSTFCSSCGTQLTA